MTHDAIVDSHCKRVIFLKNGKIRSQLYKGEESRKRFFQNTMKIKGLLARV